MRTLAELALWLLVLAPAVAGATLLLARGIDRLAAAIAVATSTLVLLLSIVTSLVRPHVAVAFLAGTDFALRVDALAAIVVPAVSAVTLLVLIFATGDILDGRARFHGLMLLFASAVIVTATATTLPTLLMAWEVMGATSYALIGFWWRDESRVVAGLTAFLTTRSADLGLYLSAAAALAGGAGLALADLPDASGGWRHVVAFGVLVAALGKAAQLPFSFWLSRAMAGPSAVSALLHSAAMVAMGAYLLLRVGPLLAVTGWAAAVAMWVGIGTAVLLGAVAVAQRDLKQLLAASTAAQLGFVVAAAGLGAIGGGVAQLIAHAFTKAGLFLAAGAWLSVVGTKRLDELGGVARRWRVLGWSASVGALALAGVAPLSLWVTKDAVLAAALHYSAGLYAAGLAASALSAAYAGKILMVMWRNRSAADNPDQARENPGPNGFQQASVVVLAVGAAVAGVLAVPPIAPALSRALGRGPTPPTVLELVGSAALAIVVVVAVTRWRPPEPRWAEAWLGLERAAHVVVVRPTLGLGRILAQFDDAVLDRLVDVTANQSLRAARRLARNDIRLVDGAVDAVAGGMRRLGTLARTPQTGLVHQYLLAAVVVTVLGFLLLIVVR
ncbi:MAG: NADH-quinone oxidoreductase subunit L [Mycobacterium pseudokansasii]|uniref:NADH-quinone oxidoreductase subunit 12 n=1 Tax=Mycobacterium pseudokansasii TaxID=2341080 RepID=A0A498QQ41_9MYCO|nr:proton-conducting transporter membrane subunit [Mycobacterium pseudokansasii]MBY0389936.1 NADH-quinone oxidoreductase subunit L [Mycobacterium pseudokansasii]VAZ93732.1 NADH-quinone oxidoreductase subunit 12 [Mycobacterium pseudokansasii]VAZ94712.1 NADH-quinone oxidoreductase subunit 12 [Mycobacterium pseudokansasii]VBA49975.1 NADH-quinone oxidoreductase subunit 12 [Mycobacterium pseudokansasii]